MIQIQVFQLSLNKVPLEELVGGGTAGNSCGCEDGETFLGSVLSEGALVFFTSMLNLIPPRQCPSMLHRNQYFLASVSSTRSSPLSYFANTPLLASHDLNVPSTTSYTLCCPFTYLNTTRT